MNKKYKELLNKHIKEIILNNKFFYLVNYKKNFFHIFKILKYVENEMLILTIFLNTSNKFYNLTRLKRNNKYPLIVYAKSGSGNEFYPYVRKFIEILYKKFSYYVFIKLIKKFFKKVNDDNLKINVFCHFLKSKYTKYISNRISYESFLSRLDMKSHDKYNSYNIHQLSALKRYLIHYYKINEK